MSDDEEPLHLDDEDETGRSEPAPEAPPSHAVDAGDLTLEPDAGPPRHVSLPPAEPPAPEDEPAVSTQTVAEREGRAVEVLAGRRPPPLGWPEEAFGFPLRAPGLAVLLGGALVWVLLDLATHVNLFLGLLLKVPALVFFLRWQLHVASMTAAGWDRPAGWASSLELDREHLRGVAFLLGGGLLLAGLTAGLFAWVSWIAATVAFALGSLWLAAVALGQTVGDPAIGRPFGALEWIGRRPLGLLAATVGWWAFAGTEIAIAALSDESTSLVLFVAAALRLGVLYLWLVSARALGVVGRAWSPWDTEDGAPPG